MTLELRLQRSGREGSIADRTSGNVGARERCERGFDLRSRNERHLQAGPR